MDASTLSWILAAGLATGVGGLATESHPERCWGFALMMTLDNALA